MSLPGCGTCGAGLRPPETLALTIFLSRPRTIRRICFSDTCCMLREAAAQHATLMIELTRVSYTYPNARSPALHDLSLTIDEGAFVVVCGPSGAGKSTFLR